MADIFISYSGADKSIVKALATLLEEKGWTTWWDRHIPIGQRFDNVIETELHNARCVIVIWTKQSVASEWVKNEASEALQRGVLVPILLENVVIPLNFRRVEAALLTAWNGEPEHPELEMLFNSVKAVLSSNGQPPNDQQSILNGKEAGVGSSASIGVMHFVRKRLPLVLSITIGVAFILLFLFFSKGIFGSTEQNITVRVYDYKKRPVTEGEVKIYLNEYIRTQSLDKMGQALFTGIPAERMANNRKIEVSSPGYATRIFDTLLSNSQPLELVLPLSTVVFIRGKVKTAAEVPISAVEITVDGTRYYALSLTDGSYNLRLEEYTIGDEITVTTSHPKFEDKTISIKINGPEIKNQDIFLNPVTP